MRSHEHRAVGDLATGGAMVNVAGEAADEALWLTFGDVVALSGDFFPPDVLFAWPGSQAAEAPGWTPATSWWGRSRWPRSTKGSPTPGSSGR